MNKTPSHLQLRSADPSLCQRAQGPRRLRHAILGASAFAFAAGGMFAQLGDKLDKAGEVQKSLVPAELVPPARVLTPAEALQSFKLAPGFKLEIAACEPLVQDPVAAVFGPDGRLWVVEMRGYMNGIDGEGEDQAVGRVVVLGDRDGDGDYDESTVFLDNLVLPRAIALVGDGVLVGTPPELVHWRDTDGDGKADRKTVVATDYGVKVDPKRPYVANPERAPNSLLWTLDNWIYSAAYTRKFRFVQGEWQVGVTSFRGQWGLSQDDAGHLFHNSNSDQLRVDVVFSDYLQRNPDYPRLAGANVNAAVDQLVWPGRVTPGINRGYRPEMLREGKLKEFTAACAPWIYRGDLMPEFYGSAFVAEPAGNLVRRNVLAAKNGTLIARNAYEKAEFITSTDERFRPVNFTTGPDGALYIIDFSRGVIEHRISVTSYLRNQIAERNLVNPQRLGRIYRVVPVDRPAPRATKLPALTDAQWVERLAHPNSWWRETAQRLLVERSDPANEAAIRRVATDSPSPLGRLHALWTLEGTGALDRAIVLVALADQAPVVRTAAIRLSERFLGDPGRDEIVQRLLGALRDGGAEVQLQAMLSLGTTGDFAIDHRLAEIVRSSPGNTYLRDAFLSGLAGRELAVLRRILEDKSWDSGDPEGNKLVAGLASGVFTSRRTEEIERTLELVAGQLPGAHRRAMAMLDGLAMAAESMRRPVQFSSLPGSWDRLGEDAAGKTRLAKLSRLMLWPGKPGSAIAATTSMAPAQTERFAAGRTLFATVCAACHQASGRGLDGLAPPLVDSEWVLGAPERLVRIALNGVRGPIIVLGRTHAGDMPGFGALDDQQISAVLTYLRREWGHAATPIDPAQVAAVRAATAGRSDAWSPEELNEFK